MYIHTRGRTSSSPGSAFCANGRDRQETRFHQLNMNGRNLIFNGSYMSQLFPEVPQSSFESDTDMTISDI